MVRLVDQSGAPCALHLAVRDAAGEPILELRADSPEWWDFGAVTVLHTPDGRFCGTQMPTVAYAMGHPECYYPTASSPTARFEQLEAYVAPHTSPRYIIARPLAGGPQEEWHASQLESVSERIPKLYRAFKEAEEPQREELRSVATTQTVLGDKTNGAKTKQFNDFNDGHVVDIAEIGAGDSGEDVCN